MGEKRARSHPRWNEIRVRPSIENDSLRDVSFRISTGSIVYYKPDSARFLGDGTLVARPKNPLRLIFSRNGIKKNNPYTPFDIQLISR